MKNEVWNDNDVSVEVSVEQFYSRLTNTNDSILIPDIGLFYQRVPKVAGTSISRLLLCYLFNDPDGKSIGNANVHFIIETLLPRLEKYPKEYIFRKLNSPDVFKFTFVRNPYSRLVSCYKDKIARLSTIRGEIVQWTLAAQALEARQHFYEEPKYIIYNTLMRIAAGNDPYTPYSDKFKVATFEEFVRFICSQRDSQMDHHWEPQVRTTNWGVINYDFVGKQETYKEDMSKLLRLITAPDFLYNLLPDKLNPTHETPITDYFTPQLQKLVYERFRNDFESFGYDYELPEF